MDFCCRDCNRCVVRLRKKKHLHSGSSRSFLLIDTPLQQAFSPVQIFPSTRRLDDIPSPALFSIEGIRTQIDNLRGAHPSLNLPLGDLTRTLIEENPRLSGHAPGTPFPVALSHPAQRRLLAVTADTDEGRLLVCFVGGDEGNILCECRAPRVSFCDAICAEAQLRSYPRHLSAHEQRFW